MRIVGIIISVLVICISSPLKAEPLENPHKTLYGMTPFPYDFTPESSKKTHDMVAAYGHIYAIHYDDGVPWDVALAGKPWPKKMQEDLDLWRQRTRGADTIYLGLAPLKLDRKSLAKAAKGTSTLSNWDKLDLDSPEIMKAYLNYDRRLVKNYEPDYLNIGIETGNMAHNDPQRWPKFEKFYLYVLSNLKKEWPDLKIGFSSTVGDLMKPGVGDRVRKIVDESDYIGLSFYPYGYTDAEQKAGTALTTAPDQWRKPLEWVQNYTDKPIAICETGFTTESFRLDVFGLNLHGDGELQAQYLKDLARIAEQDEYLFVIWFLMVDYDRLYKYIPDPYGIMKLWRNTGLWDSNLKPKPAWAIWKELVAEKQKHSD